MSASDPAAWLQYARDDLRVAHTLAASDLPPRVTAFHAQQAAEKALKAVLVAEGVLVPLDLSPLPDSTTLARMTVYAAQPRYPDDLPDVSAAEADEAIATAAAVLAAVTRALGA